MKTGKQVTAAEDLVDDQDSDVSGEEQFVDTVFPAEIEEIVNGRSSFLEDRGPTLAATVQAMRTVRDLEERIALKRRQYKRLWFSDLSGKLEARLSSKGSSKGSSLLLAFRPKV